MKKIKVQIFRRTVKDRRRGASWDLLKHMAEGIKAVGDNPIIVNENRIGAYHILKTMGAKIKILGNKAVIEGNVNFKAAELMATDLRASVSLILAALTAKGKSIINRIYHLDRGYENIEQKLRNVGAKIRRIS